MLWLNGGPGCSSTTGLLFELGPCNIGVNGTFTTVNPYSWTSGANFIFLDQPENTGYSYSGDGTQRQHVKTSTAAAADVYAFLQLFIQRFPKYAALAFHIAGESYAGVMVPNIASVIYKKNRDLIFAPSSGLMRINLESILLGNALTDPVIQMPSVVDFACDGPFAVFDPNGMDCTAMRRNAQMCERLIKTCYKRDTRATCLPASAHCWMVLFGGLQSKLSSLLR